jgi:hypothetical protein
MRRDLLLLWLAVLLLRLPFLSQAVQGDDVYYLHLARNALADPFHPMQMGFRYEGEVVWAAGHTRPPLNAYVLATLLAVFGEVRETYFHLAYLFFSLLTVTAMYFLARRFSNQPLLAAFVFLAAPSFVVNGNKLEADLPLLAFWLAGFALFVYGRFANAALALAAAGLCAYQSVFGVPILAHYAWYQARKDRSAWVALLAAPAAIAAWQLFERLSTGTAPATVLADYFQTYNLLALETKLGSALALFGHLGFLVSPLIVALAWRPAARKQRLFILGAYGAALLPAVLLNGYSQGQRMLLWLALATGLFLLAGVVYLLLTQRSTDDGFLAAWVFVFFGCSVIVFYAGSARYLLPLAPAVVLLIVRHARNTSLVVALTVVHLALSLGLARAEYEYDNQYRAFAQRLAPLVDAQRIWTNAEWGLRYYLGELGGEPLLRGQPVYAGSIVVTSALAASVPFESQGVRTELMSAEVSTQSIPLRTIGLGVRSGYSSSNFGVLPFDFGAGVIDRVTASGIGLAQPTTGYLSMNSPEAEEQLLAGFYHVEDGQWRWMGSRGAALLLVPERASQFELVFYIPEGAPARRVTVAINANTLTEQSFPGPGMHTLQAPFSYAANQPVHVVISVDQTFQPTGDARRLGVIVHRFGVK